MPIPTPPGEDPKTTALVHLAPPKRPLSTPSPEPQHLPLTKRLRTRHHCPFNLPTCHGCQSPSKKNRSPPTAADRKAHAALFWQTMTSIAQIPPAKTHLVQLQQAFLDSYFSLGVVSSHRQYFHIFYWLAPASAAMMAARDALCMIHLGSRHRDYALVHEGQRRHLAAIGFLRRDLARPGAMEDDAVLGANYTLGQAEVFTAVNRSNPQYVTHLAGLQLLLRKRGPGSMTSPFARALLFNIRSVSVMHGLLSRTPLFLAEEEWLAAGRMGSGGGVTIGVELTDLCLRIPTLLQRGDMLAARPEEAEEGKVVEVLTALTELEHKIQEWLLDFYRLTGTAEQLPYRLRSLSNYPFFHAGCGGLAHVFPSMIEFPAFLSATTHIWVWTCLLVIRQSILDVAALHPYPTVRARDQKASLTASIDECAINLCQSIAYLLNPDHHAACGVLACSPALYFSALWFQRQGQTQRLIWARHVREFLQRDVLLGGGYDTSINITRPMFVWWMLPDIPAKENANPENAGKIIEETEDSSG